VLHQKFGFGTVLTLEGATDSQVASIEFKDIDQPVRKLMLKFAKLQVINE
jgi:DNA helicase-2/ATP-dependent DNA helicase PcrA